MVIFSISTSYYTSIIVLILLCYEIFSNSTYIEIAMMLYSQY